LKKRQIEEVLSLKKRQIEEEKALNLIKLRRYKLLKRKKEKDAIIFTVKVSKGKKAIIECLLNTKVVGVMYARKLKKFMDEKGVEKGVIVANSKYTAACKRDARKFDIELIPKHIPSFNIFKHMMVPKHEILPPEKAEILLKRYRIEAYQLPQIRAYDPAVIVIGAKVGDVIKITRKSLTAGKYIAYRHVVP